MRIFFVFILVLFVACTNEPQKPTTQPINQEKNLPSKVGKKVTGMLRGIILSQQFDSLKKMWVYKLKVQDMVREDLDSIDFFYTKKVFEEGDLVYVLFSDRELYAKEIILIKRSYKKIKTLQKRTKDRQIIGKAKVNTIKLY